MVGVQRAHDVGCGRMRSRVRSVELDFNDFGQIAPTANVFGRDDRTGGRPCRARRSWGLNSREDLSEWIHNSAKRGGVVTTAVEHKSAFRRQRTSGVCVHPCCGAFLQFITQDFHFGRPTVHNSWEVLDGVCLADVF